MSRPLPACHRCGAKGWESWRERDDHVKACDVQPDHRHREPRPLQSRAGQRRNQIA